MSAIKEKKYTLSVPGVTDNLATIRSFIRRIAQKGGFAEDDSEEIELAVDEACTNAIKHAYHFNKEQTIDLEVVLDSRKITIRISDRGMGFEAKQIKPPDLKKSIMEGKSGGLGIHMMRSLMDEVRFRMNPGKKNTVTLIKYRSQKTQ